MSASRNRQEEPQRTDRLAQAILATVTAHRDSTPEELTQALTLMLRAGWAIGKRIERPRRNTPLAEAQKLPEVGVSFEHRRKGKAYLIRVISKSSVECEIEGTPKRFQTLKSLATAILGYQPAVGGWRFFFGDLTHSEVNARYRKAP